MENLRRKIALFLVSYGKLFLFIIGVIFIIIFSIQSLNSMVIEQNVKKYNSEEYQNKIEEDKQMENAKVYISKFIDYCNNGKIQQAYEMLSEECKQDKYNTIQEFEEKYINKKFYIKICEYSITKKEEIYEVSLTQDMLATGKQDVKIETTYKIEGISKNNIYIYD